MNTHPTLSQFTRTWQAKDEELKACYERIAELEDLARNVAGLDARLINSFDVIRPAAIEWRNQAQELLK